MEELSLQLFNLKEQANKGLSDTDSIKKVESIEAIKSPQIAFEKALTDIFLSPAEENKLVRARQVLGETIKGVSDEQLNIFINELQYLLDGWFDTFEKQVFGGSTLREVLKGGQNGKP